jgi:hypothetical protein
MMKGSLCQVSDDRQGKLPSEWVKILLDLREHEFSLFGCFSALSMELVEKLDTISSVSAAVNNLASMS